MNRVGEAWLIAIDVDRTLLTDDYRLLPEVRDAVQRARTIGVIVVLATARSPSGLTSVLRDLGDVDAAICFGGGLTLKPLGPSLAAYEGCQDTSFTRNEALVVLRHAASLGVNIGYYARDVAFVSAASEGFAREFRHTGEPFRVAELETLDKPAYKFLAITDRSKTDRLDQLAKALAPTFSALRSHSNYLEINPPGVSKGMAIEALIAVTGLSRSRTIAIGDSENDLSMLAAVGHPIAMGNAVEDAKALAIWVTESNAAAGVAVAIHRCARELWLSVAPALPE